MHAHCRTVVCQQLTQWFNNHTRDTTSGEGRTKLLDLSGKKTRKLTLLQAYSKLYYDDKVKETVEKEWEQKVNEFNKTRGPDDKPLSKLPFIKKVTERFWKNEMDDVIAKVERYREEQINEEDSAQNPAGDDDEAIRVAKAQAYHR